MESSDATVTKIMNEEWLNVLEHLFLNNSAFNVRTGYSVS